MNLVPVYSNESNMFWITKQKTHAPQDWYHSSYDTQTTFTEQRQGKLFHDSPSPSIPPIQGGFVFSSDSSSTHTASREEGENEEERKMRRERRLPSSPHLLIAPSVDLDVRYCASVSHVVLSRFRKTIHSVLRHYSTDFFITAAVYH